MRRPATSKELAQYLGLFAAWVGFIYVTPGPWRNWSKGKSLDMWTLTHVVWGAIGARMHQSFNQQMALAVANEALEAWFKPRFPDLPWGEPEPALNVPLDVAANALGWWIGRQPAR